MKIFLKYYLPLFIWAFLIFYLSAVPHLKSSFPQVWDLVLRKAAHLFEFGILALLLLRLGLRQEEKNKNKLKIYLAALVFSLLYAGFDEWHQGFVPGRSASFYDVLIDAMGIFGGAGAYLSVKKNV